MSTQTIILPPLQWELNLLSLAWNEKLKWPLNAAGFPWSILISLMSARCRFEFYNVIWFTQNFWWFINMWRNAKVIDARGNAHTRLCFCTAGRYGRQTISFSTENSNLAPVGVDSYSPFYRYCFLASQMIVNPSFVCQTRCFDFGPTVLFQSVIIYCVCISICL